MGEEVCQHDILRDSFEKCQHMQHKLDIVVCKMCRHHGNSVIIIIILNSANFIR